MSDFAIRAEKLSKRYRIGQLRTAHAAAWNRIVRRAPSDGESVIWAVRDVSFEIGAGEVVGVIGRNGAGKSTLLKILSRITDPTSGYADVRGRVGSLLEVGTGFHGDLTGRENVFLNGAILGMSRSEIARKFDEIVEFAGVEAFIDTPVKRYSSGMYVRLAFAVAAHLEPEILIIDEVLSVGDAEFQKRCLGKMDDVARQGRTVLFVSHYMQSIRSLCSRAILLDQGRVVLDDETETVVRTYLSGIQSAESGRWRWTTPEERPGDEHCRLVEVCVTRETGEHSNTFFSSRPVYVNLEVEVATPHPALCVGFDLISDEGSCVFRSYQTDVPDDELSVLEPGRHLLRCTIPSGLLNAGRYFVSPRISLHFVEWIAQVDPVISFEVVRDHGASAFLVAGGRPGTIAPVLHWDAAEVSVQHDLQGGRGTALRNSAPAGS